MTGAPDPLGLIGALADQMAGRGLLTDPRWRRALHAVPRQAFVPAAAWVTPDADGVPGFRIDKDADPAGWRAAVYSDASIVTQVNDGAGDPSAGTGRFSSSVSAPGIVVAFGELLDIQPGDQILEIGTGSGWTACLLACLAGPRGRVVSVEIDPDLSARAQAAITAVGPAGAAPVELIVADAAAWDPSQAGGPFDRLHVTCGVSQVPWSWMAALRPGGVAALPWCPPFGIGSKARLARTGDAEATGSLHGPAGYMMLRAQRPEPGTLASFLHHWDARRVTATPIDPRTVVRNPVGDWRAYGGDVAISALAPGVRYDLCPAKDGSGEASLWLRETFPGARETGSWALVEYVPGNATYEVASYGPRDLWAEVSAAFLRWCSWGRPRRDRFGLTLTPRSQNVWLDQPAQTISEEDKGREEGERRPPGLVHA